MVKEKPNQIRTYDKDGFRLRAACVCVRDDTEQEVRRSLIYAYRQLIRLQDNMVLVGYNGC